MRSNPNSTAIILTLILLTHALTLNAAATDPVVKARTITSCLLKLVDQIVPLITLVFFLLGGITYITAVDDQKKRVMGKKYIIFGLTGYICVKFIVGVASMPLFNITPGLCPN